MIRRGLQIVLAVGVIALGASPSYGQAGTSNMPTAIFFQDFANKDLNGYYTRVGVMENSGGYIWQRFTTTTNAPKYWVQLLDQTPGIYNLINIWTNYPAFHFPPWASVTLPGSVDTWPAAYTGSIGAAGSGSVVFFWGADGPDPYDLAFPDWESAAVKIPLGFGFAMAFWAAALAMHVPMKWVRSLADAAS